MLRLISGNAGKRPIPRGEPMPEGPVERPDRMPAAVARLWDRWIARAFWLTWAESPKALMWCYLQAEFERAPGKMLSARIAQLRTLGSELGFDVASRARLHVRDDDDRDDPAHRFFQT